MPEARIPVGAQVLSIDAERTVVTMRVRRAGPLARLGHNHVIASSRESGRAWLGRDLQDCGFELHLPVNAFVVDDPAARSAAGPEFAGVVPADAREGTFRNMLRPEVLDGERHPRIVVHADRVAGTWERPVVVAHVTLRSVTRVVEAPVELRRDARQLVARGTLGIRQTDFGITPFSVGGGAIQVADEVEVDFEIVAVAP